MICCASRHRCAPVWSVPRSCSSGSAPTLGRTAWHWHCARSAASSVRCLYMLLGICSGPMSPWIGGDVANTAQPGERWPALAAEPAALAWLGIRSDLGLAPRTLDAYSRGLSEYLAFCAAVSTDPLTAGRAHV